MCCSAGSQADHRVRAGDREHQSNGRIVIPGLRRPPGRGCLVAIRAAKGDRRGSGLGTRGSGLGARGSGRSRPDTKVTEWTGHIGNRSDGIGGGMPWKETCAVDQRVALLADWVRGEWTMTELAARYGISRKTAYKWIGAVRGGGCEWPDASGREPPAHPGRAIAGRAARGDSRAAAGASALGPAETRARSCGSGSPTGRGRPRARWARCCVGRA